MKSINLLKNDVTKFVVNNETGFSYTIWRWRKDII